MSLVGLIILLIVLMVVLWIAWTYIRPALPPPIGNAVVAILALVLIVWLLSLAGAPLGLDTRVH